MLLIKPSLWARVGVGAPRPLDRSRVCYPHGVRRFRSHNERRVTSTNPVGQPQASHHQHLQAVQCCQHAWSSFSSFRDSGQRLFRGNYLDAPPVWPYLLQQGWYFACRCRGIQYFCWFLPGSVCLDGMLCRPGIIYLQLWTLQIVSMTCVRREGSRFEQTNKTPGLPIVPR